MRINTSTLVKIGGGAVVGSLATIATQKAKAKAAKAKAKAAQTPPTPPTE